jgi:hypothetical protein
MKNILKISIVLLNIIFCAKSFSQSDPCGPDGKQRLAGKWTASCPIEFMNKASMTYCELCPFVIDSLNKSKAELKDIEMTFLNDSIKFNRDGKQQTVVYAMNKDTHSFQFNLNKRKYKFRVFYIEKKVILENSDGLTMLLERTQ